MRVLEGGEHVLLDEDDGDAPPHDPGHRLEELGGQRGGEPEGELIHQQELAGPVVELLEPSALFPQAAAALVPGGKLIGVIPCLRDNSPESRGFTEIAAATLWPYYTAEELLEMLRETGGQLDSTASGFRAVPQFNEAVLGDRLGFKGFNRIFERLTAQGYDPMEVGWGELRFVASLNL